MGTLGPSVDAAESRLKISLIFGITLMLGSSVAVFVTLLAGVAIRAGEASSVVFPLVAGLSLPAMLQPLGLRPIQRRWQVPYRWHLMLDLRTLTAFYGLLLGPGALTAVVVSGYWVFLGASVFMPPLALVTGWLMFSLVRAVGFWLGASRLSFTALPGIARSGLLLWPTATLCAVLVAAIGRNVY